MKIHTHRPQRMKKDVVDVAFKVHMVVIVDPSLLCCVNLQASANNPSSSRLKHLWRRNGSNIQRVSPCSSRHKCLWKETIQRGQGIFFKNLGKWFIEGFFIWI